jgi:putative transposase
MNNNQLLPYWSNHVDSLNKDLWVPHKSLLSNIASINSNTSWFSFQSWNNPNYSNKLQLSSLPQIDNIPIIKAKKIRVYPNSQQKNLFRQWLGTSRKVYNDTVNHLNLPKENREKHWMGAAKIILNSLPEWAKSIPYQVKKIAVEDAYKAFSNGCKKAKLTGKPFKLKFRTRKGTKQSCFIPSSALKKDGDLFNIYPTIVGKLKVSECLPSEFKDSRLIFEHGRWFIMVPYKVLSQSIQANDKQISLDKVVALDPGVRTFLNGFSDKSVFKIGQGDFSRIARLCSHMDKLISKISKAKNSHKQKMKKALGRMKHKIWDLVDELHFQSINYLLKTYDVVLLPNFETSKMVVKSSRKIQSKTVRSMLTYSFFQFSQRLEIKAKELGKYICRGSEAYTSKTASWTGEMKNISSAKTIKSNNIVMDRDINGARGIFLRALGDSPWAGLSSLAVGNNY